MPLRWQNRISRGETFTQILDHCKGGYKESPIYDMLCRPGVHEWTIAPLQFTTCAIRVRYIERDWWYRWIKWALNACAPAVPSNHDITPRTPQRTKRFTFVMRQLHTARIDRDFTRIHFLQQEVTSLAKQFNIATASNFVIRVPYMDCIRQQHIHSIVPWLSKSGVHFGNVRHCGPPF